MVAELSGHATPPEIRKMKTVMVKRAITKRTGLIMNKQIPPDSDMLRL
jgi:hypothetical protein